MKPPNSVNDALSRYTITAPVKKLVTPTIVVFMFLNILSIIILLYIGTVLFIGTGFNYSVERESNRVPFLLYKIPPMITCV